MIEKLCRVTGKVKERVSGKTMNLKPVQMQGLGKESLLRRKRKRKDRRDATARTGLGKTTKEQRE
jgi:hypothetical protein